MSNGTLSENRATPEVVQPKIQTPIIKVIEEPPVLDKEPTVITQTVTTIPDPRPTEPKTELPTTEHVEDSSCLYCKAEAITTLAIRVGFVMLLLAFSFNLLKSTKQ